MEIDWNKLESCAGTADPSEIPEAINLLFSEDASKRKQGYWGIDNHAVLQGDLYSTAPYAARLIVDKLISGEGITNEVVNILFELHNGYGPQILEIGPLAGKSLEELCQTIVSETKQYLLASVNQLPPESASNVKKLLSEIN